MHKPPRTVEVTESVQIQVFLVLQSFSRVLSVQYVAFGEVMFAEGFTQEFTADPSFHFTDERGADAILPGHVSCFACLQRRVKCRFGAKRL